MDANVNVNSYAKNPISLFSIDNVYIPLELHHKKMVNFYIKPMEFVREEDYIQLG